MSIVKRGKRVFFSKLIKISPVMASKILFYKTFGRWPNFKRGKTFNEKLMWLKLYEDDMLKTKCADKYLVRNYISKLGFSELLIDLYAVYEDVEEVDFQKLPKSFVMKCSHGSGFNIICPDKDKIDEIYVKKQLKKWLQTDYGTLYCEPHYSPIKPRITVERFLNGEKEGQLPIDYMIHCFHGVPRVIEVGVECELRGKLYSTYNYEWDPLPYYKDSLFQNGSINKPEKLEEMLEIAKILSKAFTYVRVDLYYSRQQIYFGELTFTPGACLERDFIPRGEYQMGGLLDLSLLKKERQSKVSLIEYLK